MPEKLRKRAENGMLIHMPFHILLWGKNCVTQYLVFVIKILHNIY